VTPKRGQKRKTVRPARQAVSPVVSAAYAKSKFGDLLKAVERGETVTIERYNRPVAKLSPAQEKGAHKVHVWLFKGAD
jgi:prevent-host-death family protein